MKTALVLGLAVLAGFTSAGLGIAHAMSEAELLGPGYDISNIIEEESRAQDLAQMESEYPELFEWRQYMLGLINEERLATGLEPVTLGTNEAAQTHAKSMLENCFLSHWGLDGLKPYMRYALAGGTDYDAENASSAQYCIGSGFLKQSARALLSDAMDGFMNSPGHRDNILDPHHARVNLGIAYNGHTMSIAQHFEYDYTLINSPPTISENILRFDGYAHNGVSLQTDDDLFIYVYYDPPPHNLTRGQVERTYSYNYGIPVAAIVPPPPPGSYYQESSFTLSTSMGVDPYDIPADTPALASYDVDPVIDRMVVEKAFLVPYIEAQDWRIIGNWFVGYADISSILQKYGPGVYTVVFYGKVGYEHIPIGQGVIFHPVKPKLQEAVYESGILILCFDESVTLADGWQDNIRLGDVSIGEKAKNLISNHPWCALISVAHLYEAIDGMDGPLSATIEPGAVLDADGNPNDRITAQVTIRG